MSIELTRIGRSVAPAAIAVSGVDFGWGSAGKLSAILTEVRRRDPGVRVIGIGTQLGRPVLEHACIDAWYDTPTTAEAMTTLLRAHDVAAGLVVLDPVVAALMIQVDLPTVFVDSLPFLWTAGDPLPHAATTYCAQYCTEIPQPAWDPLRQIKNLRWVEAITSTLPTPGARNAGSAVINLGGLHSPANPHGNDTYLCYILQPTLAALANTGHHRIAVCGSVAPAQLLSVDTLGLDLTVGPRSHEDFLSLLTNAETLVTSPGLTTLLEASGAGTPTVCLPPQNVSQIFNGDRFAASTDPACRVRWPANVLDLDAVQTARVRGEEYGLAAMDDALRSHEPDDARQALTAAITAAIVAARSHTCWRGMAAAAGNGGAAQIADIVLEATLLNAAAP